MPSLLQKLNGSKRESSPSLSQGRRGSSTSSLSEDALNRSSSVNSVDNIAVSTSPTKSISPPKLILLADDEDEYPSPSRGKRAGRDLLENDELRRTVSAEDTAPARIVSANGYTGHVMGLEAAGPKEGSLSLDHLLDRSQSLPSSADMPQITLHVSQPDSGSLSAVKGLTDRRRSSVSSSDGIILPRISSSSTSESTMTITDAIPGSMRYSPLAPSTLSAPAPPIASVTAPVTSGRKSLSASDSPIKARAIAGRLSRSPSRSSGGVGIAGALAASGMAMAAAHGHAGPASQPMLARSNTQSTDDSDNMSMESGRSGTRGLQAVPSMEALSIWDVVGTGYALASARRNLEFHQLFPNVPEDDYLVEDYGCALARDILIQGRLYISEHHLCFNANIFGWVTSLAIPFSEIVSIEKKMTALVIPNAIQVATLHARHQFASFLSRDTTYDLLINIWRIFHPALPSVARSETARSDVDPDEEIGAEDDSVEDEEKKRQKSKLSIVARRKRGKSVVSNGPTSATSLAVDSALSPDQLRPPSPGTPRPVPNTHAPTSCACGKSQPAHYANVCMDAQFSTTPEKLYNLIFTSGFIKTFWNDNQKLTEVSLSDWAPGPGGNLQRNTQYIKPLNASVGPKSCKCLIRDETIHVDFDDHVTVLTTTTTPEVPSGSAFEIKTKTCITWVSGGGSRVLVTTELVWNKGSFLKGIITSSSISGQKSYHTELEKEMRAYIQQHRSEFVDASQSDFSEEVTSAAEAQDAVNAANSSAIEVKPTEPAPASRLSAVLPEPLKALIEPLLDIAQDLGSSLLSIGVGQLLLVGMLALLALGNAWSLIRSATSSPRASALQPRTMPASEQGQEVAYAVRSVLEDYFTHQQDRTTEPAAGSGSSIDWKKEARSLKRELEVIEGRVARLKAALADVD